MLELRSIDEVEANLNAPIDNLHSVFLGSDLGATARVALNSYSSSSARVSCLRTCGSVCHE